MRAIRSLCGSAIHLQSGQMVMKGAVRRRLSLTLQAPVSHEMHFSRLDLMDVVVVHNFSILLRNFYSVETIDGSPPFDAKVNFDASLRDLNLFRTGIYLKTIPMGDTVLRLFIATGIRSAKTSRPEPTKQRSAFPGKFLIGGNYLVSFHASRHGIVNYFADTQIQQLINVSTPTEFNSAHLSENVDLFHHHAE